MLEDQEEEAWDDARQAAFGRDRSDQLCLLLPCNLSSWAPSEAAKCYATTGNWQIEVAD